MSDRPIPVTLRATGLPGMNGRLYRLLAVPRIGESFTDDGVRMRVVDVDHNAYSGISVYVVPDEKANR